MTYISPLLANTLANKNRVSAQDLNYDKIYEDLKLKANEVRPNVAKAKLVKETPLQATASYFKDLGKDVANFTTAVKTGKMNDNSLGRLNDLGLKVGALGIATFLAAHSKTKKDAIMQFIGGGSFIAAMSVWPKLFINLPAKLIHGFDIGQKYISAQGDKKDFFLDNQFLPWDAYTQEEIAEIGRKTGIDINEKDGEEKIKRKMQKTALQNRTLWMATAGFSTPLMTAMAGNAIEPIVEDAVINSEFNKIAKIFKNPNLVQGRLTNAKPIVKNVEKIEELFAGKENLALGDNFFDELTKLLKIDEFAETFKDPDDAKLIGAFETSEKTAILKDELKKLFNEQSKVINNNEGLAKLKEALANVQSVQNTDVLKEVPLSAEIIDDVVKGLFTEANGNITKEQLSAALTQKGISADLISTLSAKEITAQDAIELLKKEGVEITEAIKNNLANSKNIKETLVKLTSGLSIAKKTRLKHQLEGFSANANALNEQAVRSLLAKIKVPNQKTVLSEDVIAQVVEQISKNPSLANLKQILTANKVSAEAQKEIIGKLKIDNSGFFNYIKDFNKEELSHLRGRIREVANIVNSAVGSKSESVTTKVITKSKAKIFKNLGLSQDQLKQIRDKEVTAKGGAKDVLIEHFSSKMKNIVKSENENAYIDFIKQLVGTEPNKGFNETIEAIKSSEFSTIVKPTSNKFASLVEILIGKDSKIGGLTQTIKNYTETKVIDMKEIRSRAVICANFEKRVASGEFKQLIDSNPKALNIMRNIIYSGGAGMKENAAQAQNPELYAKYIKTIFKPDAFAAEIKEFPFLKEVVEGLANAQKVGSDFEKNYFKNLDIASFIKTSASQVYNNKVWMKRFGTMSAALVAVTLLVQPFFGNIKKEFANEGKNGGAK